MQHRSLGPQHPNAEFVNAWLLAIIAEAGACSHRKGSCKEHEASVKFWPRGFEDLRAWGNFWPNAHIDIGIWRPHGYYVPWGYTAEEHGTQECVSACDIHTYAKQGPCNPLMLGACQLFNASVNPHNATLKANRWNLVAVKQTSKAQTSN